MSTKALKILCVDDEADLLDAMGASLEAIGLEVLKASNVEEGLRIAAAEGSRIVGVVSDLKMPGGGGLELREKLLAEGSSLPFLVLSGNVDESVAARAGDLQISAILEKPFTAPALLEAVKRETKSRSETIREEDELLEGFIGEATSLLEEMEQLLLRLEESRDEASLNRLFSCAHTIKGTSGYFRPDTLQKFTHRFEDYIQQIKAGKVELDGTAIGVSLTSLDTIRKLLDDLSSGVHRLVLGELVGIFEPPVAGAAPKASARVAEFQTAKQDELKVAVPLLESFMEKSGEVTVLRHMINKVMVSLEQDNRDNPNFAILGSLLNEMHKANSFVQDQITDLRKVPLMQVLRPLGRVLRDLCASLNKSIRLESVGEDLRIDHKLASALSNCLVHLLRNSADHGVEMPAARLAAGKPETGTIRFEATTRDGWLTLRVSDDGKGMDPQFIFRKAIEKGLITADAKMAEEEILALIFHPGFSTAEKVSDVSGRGVGADMVRTTVLDLGGDIVIRSQLGKGTEFIITLPEPKSVLIASTLIVRLGNEDFAIAREKIERVIRLQPEDARLETIGNAAVFREGGKVVPLVVWQKMFGLREGSHPAPYLIQLQTSAGALALTATRVLEIEEVVVKPITPWVGQCGLYAGATFLGDGRVSLVLDPEGIVRHLRLDPRKTSKATHEEVASVQDQFLLVQLAGASVYAFERDRVERVERIAADKIQVSGRQPSVVYRGTVIPVLRLEELLGASTKEAPGGLMVILSVGARRVGVLVNEIIDLTAVNAESASVIGGRRCQQVGDHLVTFLDEKFWKALEPSA